MTFYSPTHWWSKWEVMNQLLLQFGDIGQYLTSNQNVGAATSAKLLVVFSTPQQKGQLQLELAATVDVGELFVKTTDRLEGDGPLALECFEMISMLQASIRNNHHPNVDGVAR